MFELIVKAFQWIRYSKGQTLCLTLMIALLASSSRQQGLCATDYTSGLVKLRGLFGRWRSMLYAMAFLFAFLFLALIFMWFLLVFLALNLFRLGRLCRSWLDSRINRAGFGTVVYPEVVAGAVAIGAAGVGASTTGASWVWRRAANEISANSKQKSRVSSFLILNIYWTNFQWCLNCW